MFKIIIAYNIFINYVISHSIYGILMTKIYGKHMYKPELNSLIYFNDSSCYYYIDFININDAFYENINDLYIIEIPQNENLIIKNITTYRKNTTEINIYCSNMVILKEDLEYNEKNYLNPINEKFYYSTAEYLETFYYERSNETNSTFETFKLNDNTCLRKKLNLHEYEKLEFITNIIIEHDISYDYYINSFLWIMDNIDIITCWYNSNCYIKSSFIDSNCYNCSNKSIMSFECIEYYNINPYGDINVINLIDKLKYDTHSIFNKKILSILYIARNDKNFNTYFIEYLKIH